jgi:hypothetical protein
VVLDAQTNLTICNDFQTVHRNVTDKNFLMSVRESAVTMPYTDLDLMHALAIGKIQISQLPTGIIPTAQQQVNQSSSIFAAPVSSINGTNTSQPLSGSATTTYVLTQPVAKMLLSLGSLIKGDVIDGMQQSDRALTWNGVQTSYVSSSSTGKAPILRYRSAARGQNFLCLVAVAHSPCLLATDAVLSVLD